MFDEGQQRVRRWGMRDCLPTVMEEPMPLPRVHAQEAGAVARPLRPRRTVPLLLRRGDSGQSCTALARPIEPAWCGD